MLCSKLVALSVKYILTKVFLIVRKSYDIGRKICSIVLRSLRYTLQKVAVSSPLSLWFHGDHQTDRVVYRQQMR